MTLEEAHNLRRDRAIEALQHHMERMVYLLEDDPPDLEESSNPEDYYEWVQAMDRIREVKGYDDKKAFKVVVIKLKKYASMWYDNLKRERQYEGKKTIKTWSKLKECKQKRFVPQAYKQDLYIQMNTLKQGSMNVVDYIREFEQLKICTNVKEAEEHTIARFVGGLNASIVDQRALTLMEIEDLEGGFETKPAYDESDSEEFVAAVIGEFLMIRRVKHSAETIGDKSQRENIFHSRCTVKGKVCILIVDGGSCTNAASAHMVEKLELGKKITIASLKPSEIPRADPTVNNGKTLFMTQTEVDTELKAYRCSPHEAKDLEKKVNELVAKGRYSLLSILEARVLGFSFIKELYEVDPDFALILNCSPAESKRDYVEQDGFLFKGSRLCIPKDSIRELLIREAHGGGLAGHFGINKTMEILNEHFYWPCMDKDVKAVINHCATCFQAKLDFHKGLYTPLPVPN
ncbi:uncharacterized protein [Rutidosis leptorrhynchoides]|uniref:uncharacterized protein n=1 Tax=Rutidosis leptorrhynchoides TaxID=125765 RepID=UPI003A993A3A